MTNRKEVEIHITASIWGKEFSPRKLLAMTDLPLTDCIEVGDIWVRKSSSKVAEQGSATLVTVDKPETEDQAPFDGLLDRLVANYGAIGLCGGEGINVWVAIFRSVQGNWWASQEQIQKIAAVKGSLSVSYYWDDDPVRPDEAI